MRDGSYGVGSIGILRHVGGLAQHLEPHVDGAAPGHRRELVDRRFDGKRDRHMRRRTPGAGRHAGTRARRSEAGRAGCGSATRSGSSCSTCFGTTDVRAVRLGGVRRPRIAAIRVSRCADDDVIPGIDAARRVEARAQPLDRHRPVVVVLQIARARVDDLHRRADRARHHGGFRRVVGQEPSAEAAADARGLHVHALGRDAERRARPPYGRSRASAAARESTPRRRGNPRCSCAARASHATRRRT